ncbi:MAG: hypothetical protein ACRCZK_01930 [Oscillospiraceae bacterium]
MRKLKSSDLWEHGFDLDGVTPDELTYLLNSIELECDRNCIKWMFERNSDKALLAVEAAEEAALEQSRTLLKAHIQTYPIVKPNNNKFTKKNIKYKLLCLDVDDLIYLLEKYETDLKGLVDEIYEVKYIPGTRSNYDLPNIRLANHKRQANYGNGTIIYANLVFDK